MLIAIERFVISRMVEKSHCAGTVTFHKAGEAVYTADGRGFWEVEVAGFFDTESVDCDAAIGSN